MDSRYATMAPAEFERQFNPRAAVPDFATFAEERLVLSAAAHSRFRRFANLAYGAGSREKLDVFPAEDESAPVQIFIHGGYWRGGHKDEYSFVASGLVPAGITTVVLGYDLCPTVGLDIIVDQVRRAVLWVYRNIDQYGGNPERLFLSGNSAGAHLSAMVLAHDFAADRVTEDLIKGAFLISGVYELEPVLSITVNEEIRLRPEMVEPLSPLRHPPRIKCPLTVAVGGNEPSEWIAQSRDYARLGRENGNPVEYLELPGHHHFSITNQLADPDADLTRAAVKLTGRH